MKRTYFSCLLFLIALNSYGQIIDHNCTVLQSIPTSWIDLARANLHIVYEHTSHGSQIIDGMTGLYAWKGETYAWSDGISGGALDIDDNGITGGSDLGNPDFTSWAASTRTYLNNPENSDVNVVIWAWCGEVSSATEANIEIYLSLMSELETDYPGVTFVYMTGHLDGTGLSGNLHLRNEQIRDYCIDNNKVLYDFANIETYDPDGLYFGDKLPNDGCNYDYNGNGYTESTGDPSTPTGGDRNWAIDWQDSHTVNVDWYNTPVAHSQPLNGNLKAYAAWWLWARLAGWDGGISNIPVTGITVTGTSAITTDNGTTQLTATVSPSNATTQTVTWTIANGTGTATISTTGLVTALTDGTVTARATANDGTGVYGELIITISNQVIPVTGITVTGTSTITTDNGTTQLTATVSPSNATTQTVTWTIANGTGTATINTAGLVTALTDGTVTARATANDGTGVCGELIITISNQVIPVTGITVTGISTITTDNGTTQLTATVSPSNATTQTVTWTIANGTGTATISTAGLVTALTDGTVTARATANDDSEINGELVIAITNQGIPVNGTMDNYIDIDKPVILKLNKYEVIIKVPQRYLYTKISMVGINGHIIETKSIDYIECEFNISNLPPGIYFFSIHRSMILDGVKFIKPW